MKFKAQPILLLQGKNIQTGELAAIKVIKIESGDDFQQIEQEITMLRSCQHKNIIRWEKTFHKDPGDKNLLCNHRFPAITAHIWGVTGSGFAWSYVQSAYKTFTK